MAFGDTMSDVIPTFSEAVGQLKGLLARLAYSDAELLWVARDDFYAVRFGWYYLAPSIPPSTEVDLAAYYERGREKGLVSVKALFDLPCKVGCSVWFPETPEEEVQGWSSGLRVSVATPMPIAALVNSPVSWWLHRWCSNYSNFQRLFPSAPTRQRLSGMNLKTASEAPIATSQQVMPDIGVEPTRWRDARG
jgi:hypothetical protein